jgi:hypothetical protein
MANFYKEQKLGNRVSSLDILEHINELVESEREKKYLTYDEFLFFLKRWWCQYYKRPYKDPLLETYTFEELYFEYCDINYVAKDDKEKTSDEVAQEEYDWAAEEEAKELAEEAEREVIRAEKDFRAEDDTIVNESVGLPDDEWADRYTSDDIKHNPSADDIGDGGDIFANFES